MKVRHDFVTNSSSSSFIISRDDVSLEQLKLILVEMYNAELEMYGHEPAEDYDDYVCYRFDIDIGDKDFPYVDWDLNAYHNHYVIENNDTSRYDWGIVTDVLAKYGIPWERGVCY